VFYSIQPPALSKISVIEDSQQPYHSALYFPNKLSINYNDIDDETSCNIVFYIQYDHQEFDTKVWYFTPSLVRYT
jgi:hypothetical protein